MLKKEGSRDRNLKTHQRQTMTFVFVMVLVFSFVLCGRLSYLMIAMAPHYGVMAKELHERERKIKAKRGNLFDRNGNVIAGNVSVSTISVIHSQVKDPEKVISVLSKELELDENEVRKRVEKVSLREKVKSNVPKEVSDRIREYNLDGVMVDEDYKRYYPYGSLASHVIGFTGADNQGIIGLEVTYDEMLSGTDGAILTLTNASGIEIKNASEDRIEPISGKSLLLSLDINIQTYAEQAAARVMEQKAAKAVSIIIMNPDNGEIYGMVSLPEFNLNEPFVMSDGQKNTDMNVLNAMWRNPCISDTYEPGSTFKIITSAAALNEGVVSLNDSFHCPGYIAVEDRKIRCHKVTGHGSENFVQGVMNSCNPVFITLGARLGTDNFYKYLDKFMVLEKTGVDLPGEAKAVMHNKANVGAVELATISFGQSFQITPLRLMASVSSIINGGHSIVPHFGVAETDEELNIIRKLEFESKNNIISEDISNTMCNILESVVSEGTGKKAFVEGYHVAAKTGTSEKLPRRNNRYIASCIGFAPSSDPKVMALVLVDEPQGIYYGGTIAAPVIAELFDNILPYMGIEKDKGADTDEQSKQ
ncbi:MAG: peptidoglycan glycosyltransferase [Lachnospiraceae bacterium]|nr:peptidoglycan glycosyltransferase [Lachnospiraceae bacterium]